MPLVPQLELIRREIDAISDQATGLCHGLSEEALSWRPQPNRWSIAENLVHLETTTAVMLPAVDQAIADARRRNAVGEGPFQMGWMGRVFVWYSEPPPKIKLLAPRQLRPLLNGPALEALSSFIASQQRMIARLEQANGLHLARVRFQSPIAAYIKMNLLAFFSVFTAHERRHMVQMSALRGELS